MSPCLLSVAATLVLLGATSRDVLGCDAPPESTAAEVAAPAEPARQPESFFRELGRDFTHLASRSNLVILGIGGAAALAVHPFDQDLTDDFRSSASLDGFFEAGDVAGDGLVQGGGALATWLVGALFHQPEVSRVGQDLVRAQIVNGALTLSIKLAVDRQRPDGGRWSFPSGHASASFATATVLERHFGWKVGVPAYAAAVYIAASRLQEDKHYASDVIFGAAIGIVSGRSATFDHGHYHVSLAPLIVPGGVGIVLSGVGR